MELIIFTQHMTRFSARSEINYTDTASRDDYLPLIHTKVLMSAIQKTTLSSTTHTRRSFYIRNDSKL